MRLRFRLIALLALPFVVRAQDVSRLANLSVLTDVGTGADSSFTVGFVTSGTANDGFPVLARAIGPELAQTFRIGDAIADPRLELFAGPQRVAQNDDWGANSATLAAAAANVGAFPLPNPASKDAAMMQVLQGANSIVVSAAAGNTGRVLTEVYDRRPLRAVVRDAAQLVNMSVLKQVDATLTVGFVIDGTTPKPVLIRAIGASLASFGVQNPMRDPKLELLGPDQARLLANDNWSETPSTADELRATFRALGAFDLSPGSPDAALAVTLAPGAYTVTVDPASGSGGRVLVEVYDATRAGLTLSKATAAPGEVLTLSGQVDPSVPLEATFTSKSGQSFSTPVRRSSTGQLEVTMPALLDATGAFTREPLNLTVHAITPAGRRIVAHVARLAPAALPSTGVAPGVISTAYLRGAATLSTRALANFQEIERLTGLSTAEFRAAITEEARRAAALQAQLADVVAGRKANIPLGRYQGQPVVGDQAALALLDQLTASYVGSVSPGPRETPAPVDQLVERRITQFDPAWPDHPLRLARNTAELSRALPMVFSLPSTASSLPPRHALEPRREALVPPAAYALFALGTLMVGYSANLSVYDLLGQMVDGDFSRQTGTPASLASDPNLTVAVPTPTDSQLELPLPDKSRLQGLLQKFDPLLKALRLRTKPRVILEASLVAEWQYGQPPPTTTWKATPDDDSIAHLGHTDLASGISGSPIISTDATPRSPVGEYRLAIAAGTLSSSTYKLILRESTLAIEPALLLVTAHGQTRLPNTDNPPIQPNYVGFVNGDTAANALEGSPEFSTKATRASPVGTYPISVQRNSLSARNYRLTVSDSWIQVVADLKTVLEAACVGNWLVRYANSTEEFKLRIEPKGIGYYYDLPRYHGISAPYDPALRQYRIRWEVSPNQDNQLVFQDYDFHNAGYNTATYRAPLTLPNDRMVVYALDRTTPVLIYTRQ